MKLPLIAMLLCWRARIVRRARVDPTTGCWFWLLHPPGLRIRLLDQEPTPDEVVRWASTLLHEAEVSRHGG